MTTDDLTSGQLFKQFALLTEKLVRVEGQRRLLALSEGRVPVSKKLQEWAALDRRQEKASRRRAAIVESIWRLKAS